MVSKISVLLLPALLLQALSARAQEPLNREAPLLQAGEAGGAPSQGALTLAAAQRAQELGLPLVAAGLYRQLLAVPAGAAGDRAQMTLALVTALLDGGDIPGAAQALESQPVPLRDSAWHLREGLIAAYEKKLDPAKAELALVKFDELAAADKGWWFFLQGMLANVENNAPKALDFYGKAVAAGQAEMPRARFLLATDQARLILGTVRESDVEAARKNAENTQGKPIGYSFARDYAIMLDVIGRKPAAVEVVARQLRGLPPDEHGEADNLRLLLGLIAGAGDGAGRNALGQLLANGNDPEKQRIALQLLARASRDGPAKADLRRQLGELIGAPKPSRILEDLLAIRAQMALDEKNYAQAEEDAKALLEKFPGSQLKAQALGFLTSAAWDQGRYRTAADYASKARDELRPADRQTRAELGVLIAEAWFRAEDFRNAADAYNAVLAEPPAGMATGGLMFQRVLAEIRAANGDDKGLGARLRAIEPLLDGLARDPGFDAVNRWQSEWNLAQALFKAGETAAALGRVNQLLAKAPPRTDAPAAGSAQALPVDLRARMEWLQVRLSLDAGMPAQTLELANGVMPALDGLDPKLHDMIASQVELLKAQADFALAGNGSDPVRENNAKELLAALRKNFPGSDSAVYSYIIQADYNETRNNIVEAQRLLTSLVGEFPASSYAPYASYRAALYDEKLGRTGADGAIIRLEQLIKDYPQSDWVFAARLKEGDLYAARNDFPQAQKNYQLIRDQFPRHPGVLAAELALADCHAAQAAGDIQHADRAKEGYERLLALPTAPLDLRVEAGFKLGTILVRLGDTKRAEDCWFRDVVNQFLIEKPEVADKLGPSGRYWMSRTLLELGDLLKKEDRLDEARRVWNIILDKKLPAVNEAREKLGEKVAPPAP
jgi:cellulose synthase operon protein C